MDWCEEYLSHSKNNEILIKPTSRSTLYNNTLITIRCANLRKRNAMMYYKSKISQLELENSKLVVTVNSNKKKLYLIKRQFRYNKNKIILNKLPKTECCHLKSNIHALKKRIAYMKSCHQSSIKSIENLHKSKVNELNLKIDRLNDDLVHDHQAQSIVAKPSNSKSYSCDLRMLVYILLNGQTPIVSVPNTILNISKLVDIFNIDNCPCVSTVNNMSRELYILSNYFASQFIFDNHNITLGFDATTQEGVHVNCIYVTNGTSVHVIDIDQLPGGTAVDYCDHITTCINRLARVYCHYNGGDVQIIEHDIVSRISNTITDRATVNQATIKMLNDRWSIDLNICYCHLHPLDTISSSTRSALKKAQISTGTLFATDCFAANIVIALDKLRFNDGTGAPSAFKSYFRDGKLSVSEFPRYRGNRLHILYTLSGQYYCNRISLAKFLDNLSHKRLAHAISRDFSQDEALEQLCLLGIVGKLLTGPWLKEFYNDVTPSRGHYGAVEIIKGVISKLKYTIDQPSDILVQTHDYFGTQLPDNDLVLNDLREIIPSPRFLNMVEVSIQASIKTLESQYKAYFNVDITPALLNMTASVPDHNIAAEQCMGLFSDLLNKSRNASLGHIAAKLVSRKNNVLNNLILMDITSRNTLISKVIDISNLERKDKISYRKSTLVVIDNRLLEKLNTKLNRDRKKIELIFKNCTTNDSLLSILLTKQFEHVTDVQKDMILHTFSGDIVGYNITHSWMDDNSKILYLGTVKKFSKSKSVYTISYWLEGDVDNAEEYDLHVRQLIVDIIDNDLTFILNNDLDNNLGDHAILQINNSSRTYRKRMPNPKYT